MPRWLKKLPEGRSVFVSIDDRNEFDDEHLKKAYWWACKRYTMYHNIALSSENFIGDYYAPTQQGKEADLKNRKFFTLLRELEREAMKRKIYLPTPNIKLIQNDKKYWNYQLNTNQNEKM